MIAETLPRGPKPLLTASIEKDLVDWILERQKLGSPKSMQDIKQAAWILSKNAKDCRKFGVKGPSNGFVEKFLKRHPHLLQRKPEPEPAAIWFDNIEQHFRDNNHLDVLYDPSRVFYCNEAGFLLNTIGRIVAPAKSSKDVFQEQLTILYTFSADGVTYNPLIVYPGDRIIKEIEHNIPDGICYTKTRRGTMSTVSFCNFLRKLAQQVRFKNVPFPIALFLNGHKSQEGIEVTQVARKENIILVRLYPNEPADEGIFKPLKSLYEKFVPINRGLNGFVPSKKNFATILKRIHSEIDPNWVIKEFEISGLFPFDKNTRLKITGEEPEHDNFKQENLEIEYSRFEEDSLTKPTIIDIKQEIDFEFIPIMQQNNNIVQNEPTQTNNLLNMTSLDSPFQNFCSIIGQDKVKKFENEHFLTELENEKLLYLTYNQLKQYEMKRNLEESYS